MGVNSKRKKRIFVGFSLILVAALVVGMVLSGCAPAPAPTPVAEEAYIPAPGALPVINPQVSENPRIAYLLPNVGPWYNDKWYAFEDECEKLGMEAVMYNAGGYANVTKQVAQVEDIIAAGYDGIVLHCTSGSALIPPVKKALEAGIFVSTEYSFLAESIVPHVWEDCPEIGRIMGVLLGNLVGGEGKVFFIGGPPGQIEAKATEDGFTQVMESFFPQVQVFKEWPMADVAASLKVTEDFLTVHPDVAGIGTWVSFLCGEGVIQALKAGGYKPGDVKHIGAASILPDFERMDEGWYDYLFPTTPVTVGRISARNMAAMLRGEEIPMLTNYHCVALGQSVPLDKFPHAGWYWVEE